MVGKSHSSYLIGIFFPFHFLFTITTTTTTTTTIILLFFFFFFIMFIPLEEESVAVLEYLGFETSTAKEIFERYATRPEPNQCPDELIDYAHSHILTLCHKRYREMDVQEATKRIGLKPQIRLAIAELESSNIIWTRDLDSWVKDIIDTNYVILCKRQDLKRYAAHMIEDKKK